MNASNAAKFKEALNIKEAHKIAIKIWPLKDGEFDGTCASRKILGKSCACGGDSSCDSDKNLTQNPDHKEAYFNDSPNIIVKKVS